MVAVLLLEKGGGYIDGCGGVGRAGMCGYVGNITAPTFALILDCQMRREVIALVLLLVVCVSGQEGEDAQYLQMRRTACVILSRMHSNTEKAAIEQTIQTLQPNDQQLYINKIYATAVQKCQGEITQQEVQSFYVENSDFNPATLFPLLDGFDYKGVVNDLTTTREQDQITKFIKKFDEENQIRDEERKAKKEQEEGVDERYEMKLFGISIKDLPDTAKLVYVGLFAAIVIVALYYGLTNLDTEKKGKVSNKRRSPNKEKKEASAKSA